MKKSLLAAISALVLLATGAVSATAMPLTAGPLTAGDPTSERAVAPPANAGPADVGETLDAPAGDAAAVPDPADGPAPVPDAPAPAPVPESPAPAPDAPAPVPEAPAPVAPPAVPTPDASEKADPSDVAAKAEALTDAVSIDPEVPEAAPPAPAPEAVAEPARPAADPVRSPEPQCCPSPPESDVDVARPLTGVSAGEFAGYATGTVIHADALQHSGQRLANVDVAFSGATFSSEGLEAQLNELAHVVAPGLEGQTGFGRGNGLEIDLAESLPMQGMNDDDDLLDFDDEISANAPPDTGLVSKEFLDLEVDPIVRARVLRAQALAQLAGSGCVLGTDLAHGLGYVADIDLLDLTGEGGMDFAETLLSTSADDPKRAVSQSVSETFLVPSADGGPPFALVSETRQTIAPVTLFKGTEHEITIELLGEWVLRALVDGAKMSTIHYGPDAESPETPILRIIKDDEVAHEITFQQFLGEDGLVVRIPGLVEIAIGEDPRAIGGHAETVPALSPTAAFAGVDVVRVKLLHSALGEEVAHLADLRIGHMEVAAVVPEGGINCPGIGMAKQADPATVQPGETFTWIVTVSNPNDCLLTDVDVVDTISTTPGVMYNVLSTDPPASSVSPTRVVWNDIGPLAVGESKQLRITVAVADDSAAGTFTDKAMATGVCGPAEDEAEAGVDVPVVSFENEVTINSPTVDVPAVPTAAAPPAPAPAPVPAPQVLGAAVEQPRAVAAAPAPRPAAAPFGMLPRTGGLLGLLSGLALLGAGTLLRRFRTRP